MEKQNISHSRYSNKIKNMLAVGALSFVLLGNSDTIFAQKQQINQDIAKNLNKTNEDIVQEYFVNNFAPVVSGLKTIHSMPLKVSYKNPSLAEKYNFPDSIDLNPKIIDKNKPISLMTLVLGDKKYNIKPYKGIKITGMKMIPNLTLEDPKAVLSLELLGLLKWEIQISSKEFAQYIYTISQVPKGEKGSFFGIHLEEISSSKKESLAKKGDKEIAEFYTN